MLSWFGCVLITLSLGGCALGQISFASLPCHQRNPKIVGGHEADKHELPFMVSLIRRGGHFCGASLLSEFYVLTAGHCVCNGLNRIIKASQIQGVVGLHSITVDLNETNPPKKVHFKEIIPHPAYECTNVKNDIALLELLAPVTFTSHIQPTCLSVDTGVTSHDNELAIVSGWGWTQENQEVGERANTLRKAAVKIWSNAVCQKSYNANGKANTVIADTQMCAGYENGGIDSCWADSGGPLMSKEQLLVGIVSTGIGCGRPGLPGIYTRVSKYLPWLESVILQR